MSSWLRQIRTTSRIVKLLLQFSGWETWPARSAAKQRAASAEAYTFGVQSRRAEEMILACATLVAIDARPEVDTLPRTAFRASIATDSNVCDRQRHRPARR